MTNIAAKPTLYTSNFCCQLQKLLLLGSDFVLGFKSTQIGFCTFRSGPPENHLHFLVYLICSLGIVMLVFNNEVSRRVHL